MANDARTTDRSLALLLALLPLQWLTAGPLSVTQLVILLPAVSVLHRRRLSMYGRAGSGIFGLQLAFAWTLAVTASWSERPMAGLVDVAQMSIYVGLAFLFLVWLHQKPSSSLLDTLARSSVPVGVVFLATYLISAVSSGVNIWHVFLQATKSGDPNYLQYQLFTVVFNSGEIDANGLSSATRHGVMVTMVSVAFAALVLSTRTTKTSRWAGIALLLVVVASLSRSVLFGVALAVALYSVRTLTCRESIRLRTIIAILGLVLIVVFAALTKTGLSSLLREKFVVDVADNPRVGEAPRVLEKIDQRPLVGWGAGTPIDVVGSSAEYPHNLVLYGWHQAGIVGLLATCTIATVVVFLIGVTSRRSISSWTVSRSASDAYLLAAMLMCLALSRLMFAKAGLLAIPEWTAICLALYLRHSGSSILRNRQTEASIANHLLWSNRPHVARRASQAARGA